MSTVEIEGLRVSFPGERGPVVALEDFSLVLAEGEFTVLLGESGCGKSTALNAIAGLAKPDRGRISIGGSVVYDGAAGVLVPPNKRDLGMVFQSYALWPHLSVLENVAYPLRRRRAADAGERALEALQRVRCEWLAERYPGELSGGQQQRVALARALVGRPRLLLFDEPLSNLDAGLRRSLRDELARLHRELGFTGIYVTHDQSEALALGSRIAVMDAGRILQTAAPEEIYERPTNEYVARFFGANLVAGDAQPLGADRVRLTTPAGVFECAGPSGPVTVAFLPQAVSVSPAADGALTVAAVMYVGSHREIRLAGDGVELLALQSASAPPPAIGTRVQARIAPERIQVYARRG